MKGLIEGYYYFSFAKQEKEGNIILLLQQKKYIWKNRSQKDVISEYKATISLDLNAILWKLTVVPSFFSCHWMVSDVHGSGVGVGQHDSSEKWWGARAPIATAQNLVSSPPSGF